LVSVVFTAKSAATGSGAVESLGGVKALSMSSAVPRFTLSRRLWCKPAELVVRLDSGTN